ncbi:UNVERIFIED_CONTAM: hypothetical protein Slati_1507000 [Sesamum latifolium]|uniref:PB1-like domain-containing protein n=1 Tax=Sesamum latifolium TaxID=2727402 RepID=A0AAW2X9A8_9LAMI
MSLRHQVLVDLPDPKYHKCGKEPFVTVVIYHGGKIVHTPKAEYVDGSKSKFDFVEVFKITVDYLNKLGEKLGYMGPKKFYRFHTKSFRQLKLHTEIVKFTDAHSPQNTIFTVYLVGGESQTKFQTEPNVEPQTEPSVEPQIEPQTGSNVEPQTEPQTEPNVEPQTERNIQKGKGVVVENEDNSDFDESAWDEGDQTYQGIEGNVEESGDDSHEDEASDYEEATTESDDKESDDDFDSVVGSDEEDKGPKCVFIPRNKYNPHFEIGMIFNNKVELRDAIHSHVVSTKRSLKIIKNDKRRVYVNAWGMGVNGS